MRRTMFVVARRGRADPPRRCVARRRAQRSAGATSSWSPCSASRTSTPGSRRPRRRRSRRSSAAARRRPRSSPRMSRRCGRRCASTWASAYEGDIGMSSRVLLLLAVEGKVVRGRPRGTWISSQYRWAPMTRWLGAPLPELPAGRGPGRARPALAGAVRPGDRGGPPLVDRLDGARRPAALADVGAVEVDLEGRRRASSSPTTSSRRRRPSPGSPCSLPSTRRRWAGRRATGTWATTRPPSSTRTATPGRRSGSTGGSSAAGRCAPTARSSRSCSRTSGAKTVQSVDAEAARLTEWLRAARVVPRFPTPLHKELVG